MLMGWLAETIPQTQQALQTMQECPWFVKEGTSGEGDPCILQHCIFYRRQRRGRLYRQTPCLAASYQPAQIQSVNILALVSIFTYLKASIFVLNATKDTQLMALNLKVIIIDLKHHKLSNKHQF